MVLSIIGNRQCPGKDVASATAYMSIATTLKTLNISKAKDANGKDIEPEIGWTTGLVMCVLLFYFSSVHAIGSSARLLHVQRVIRAFN